MQSVPNPLSPPPPSKMDKVNRRVQVGFFGFLKLSYKYPAKTDKIDMLI